jgi:hypothetical protein
VFAVCFEKLFGKCDALTKLLIAQLFVRGDSAVEMIVPAVAEQLVENDSHKAVILRDDPALSFGPDGEFRTR